MADQNINVRIKHKYDTEANWSSKNPVLLKGEIAFSSDKNGQFKIGDGTNKWSALNYTTANTATSIVDYGDTSAKINIGYAGSGISGDAIKYLAGYTTGTNGATANIKDVSKDALKSWLGLGSLAYSSATIPTIPSSL